MPAEATVAALNFFIVKSLRGEALSVATVDDRGILFDRRYMVVDAATGLFMTQRHFQLMARIGTALEDGMLVLTIPGLDRFQLPLAGVPGPEREVEIWEVKHRAVEQPSHVNAALSRFLDRDCVLVRMADDYVRPNRRGQGHTGFADGYSFQGHSRGSLRDLYARAGVIIPEDHFRANVVLEGIDAYLEDRITVMRIGGITFYGQTLCTRCLVTTTDQKTGAREGEPLTTLAGYRRMRDLVVEEERHLIDKKVRNLPVFGRNFTHEGTGTIHVGQKVEILQIAPRILANVS